MTDEKCLPGDITVMPTVDGYAIQRAGNNPDRTTWTTLQVMRPWFAARDFALRPFTEARSARRWRYHWCIWIICLSHNSVNVNSSKLFHRDRPGQLSWQGYQDSNPDFRFWRPTC